MKLPSLQTLWQSAVTVVMRFPLQVLVAVVAVVLWWNLPGHYNDYVENQLVKALFVCNFALTLLLSADLFSEARQYTASKKWVLRIIALALAGGLYFALDPFAHQSDILRIGMLAFAFHLLVAFAPFIGKLNLNGFWQYNKTLFLRALTSAFYSAVLFIGLLIALFAIKELFNVHISDSTYMRLFGLMSSGFATIFFLAGLPNNFVQLEEEQSYPKALKIFTQYVLIPLMTIYLAILLVYEVKIAVEWELPKGLVSTLILGYAVFGILSLLLVYPIRNKEGNGWIRLFSRFFYLMMIPLIVLLVLAIVKRVGNYGITESRYVLIVLALWLSAITLYFLLSKKQNIKLIPVSLFVVALLSSYGPQSAFSISKYSQLSRLKKLMPGKTKDDKDERSAVMRYLVENHGLTALQAFTKADLKAVEQKIDDQRYHKGKYNYELKRQKIDTAFALLKISDSYENLNNVTVKFSNENKGMMLLQGQDAFFKISSYNYTDSIKYFDKVKFSCNAKFDKNDLNKADFRVSIGNEAPISFNMGVIAKSLYAQYEKNLLETDGNNGYFVPAATLQLKQEGKNYTITLMLEEMSGSFESANDLNWLEYEGYLLIKKH